MKDDVARALLDLPVLLQRVADDAALLVGVEAAAIYLEGDIDGAACWMSDPSTGEEGGGVASDRVRTAVADLIGGQVVATGRTVIDAGYASPDGSIRPIIAAPLRQADGTSLGTLCLFDQESRELASCEVALVEALARHAAALIDAARRLQQLSDADAFHRLLLDRLPDGVWAADEHGVFTYVSAGSEQLLGYGPDELIGRSSQLVMHESTREAFDEGYRWQVAHPDGEQTYRVNLRHKDGHPVPVELHNIGTPRNGRYGGGLGSVREMTERDRLEREIRSQAAELAASRERAHLAQELHDSVTQALFSITITAGAARMLLERGAPGVEGKLDELSDLARDALAEMRSLILELRPGSLAEEGFVPALRKYVAAVQGRTGLAIRLDLDPDLPRLPLPIEDALYRVAQEAVHNVVKHAHAHEARVRIAAVRDGVCMEVSDDGAGFDRLARTDGLGIAGIAARVERLRGSLTVDSTPGHGTVVSVTLPTVSADPASSATADSSTAGP